jgi:hypothetical protein
VVSIGVTEDAAVTAKVEMPARPSDETPVLLLAHGANNDLDHPLLATLARHLAERGITVVRFNFPYSERGASSPDPPAVLENAFRRVYDHVVDELAAPAAPVFVGGKSMGGRLAAELLSRGEEGEGLSAAGLVVLGYPLHRPGRKDALNVEPLRRIGVPSLFCVGSRDPLCDPELLRPLLARLHHPGWLYVVEGGDHSLRRGRKAGGRGGGAGIAAAAAAEFDEVAAEVTRFISEVAQA